MIDTRKEHFVLIQEYLDQKVIYEFIGAEAKKMKININFIETKGWEAEIIHEGIRIIEKEESLQSLFNAVLHQANRIVEEDRKYREALTMIHSKGQRLTVDEFREIIKHL